jgi:hypothetical protein
VLTPLLGLGGMWFAYRKVEEPIPGLLKPDLVSLVLWILFRRIPLSI